MIRDEAVARARQQGVTEEYTVAAMKSIGVRLKRPGFSGPFLWTLPEQRPELAPSAAQRTKRKGELLELSNRLYGAERELCKENADAFSALPDDRYEKLRAYLESRTKKEDEHYSSTERFQKEVLAYIRGPERQVDATTIVAHADGRYSIGDQEPIPVTQREDGVLRAFLVQSTMCLKDLVKNSGIEAAHKVVADLADRYDKRFAPAIERPGRRDNGGYHIRIQAIPADAPQ